MDELTELRALKQRMIDLANEAWSMSQKPISNSEVWRYRAIAGAITLLLDPPPIPEPLPAVHSPHD